MKNTNKLRFAALAAFSLLPGLSLAVGPYSQFIDAVGHGQGTGYYSSGQDMIFAATDAGIQAVVPMYHGLAITHLTGDYRGAPILMDYNVFGSAELQLRVPQLGITQPFIAGGSRDANVQAAWDWLVTTNVLGQLARDLAKTSPTDPVAGNPNSMMSTLVSNDYDTAFTSDLSNIATIEQLSADTTTTTDTTTATTTATPAAQSSQMRGLLGVGLDFSSLDMGGTDVQKTTLPFSYSIRNDLDPRRLLVLKMPLSVVDIGGGKAYHAGFGASYRYPMSGQWSLVPGVNYALATSKDLNSAAQVLNASLTSTYYWRGREYDVGVGNMIGYLSTLPFKYQGIKYDPKINNLVLRNGVMWSKPTRALGGRMHVEVALVDTRYMGSDLYADSTQELKFTLGTTRSAKVASSGMFRVGLSFINMPHDQGYRFEVGGWF